LLSPPPSITTRAPISADACGALEIKPATANAIVTAAEFRTLLIVYRLLILSRPIPAMLLDNNFHMPWCISFAWEMIEK
jgi:hypothetical protein